PASPTCAPEGLCVEAVVGRRARRGAAGPGPGRRSFGTDSGGRPGSGVVPARRSAARAAGGGGAPVTENDEEGLTPTGWRVPVLLTVIGVLLGVLVTDLLSSPPQLPWSAIPTLLLLALAETFTAGRTRRRIRGEPGTEPMEPLSAARLLALAKASAIFGALGMGVFVGVALTLLELDRKSTRR